MHEDFLKPLDGHVAPHRRARRAARRRLASDDRRRRVRAARRRTTTAGWPSSCSSALARARRLRRLHRAGSGGEAHRSRRRRALPDRASCATRCPICPARWWSRRSSSQSPETMTILYSRPGAHPGKAEVIEGSKHDSAGARVLRRAADGGAHRRAARGLPPQVARAALPRRLPPGELRAPRDATPTSRSACSAPSPSRSQSFSATHTSAPRICGRSVGSSSTNSGIVSASPPFLSNMPTPRTTPVRAGPLPPRSSTRSPTATPGLSRATPGDQHPAVAAHVERVEHAKQPAGHYSLSTPIYGRLR